MASASLTDTARRYLTELGPVDQETVDRAIALLENDAFRSETKIDLNLVEHGKPVYGCIIGRFWFSFMEDGYSSSLRLIVLHFSKRSAFRP